MDASLWRRCGLAASAIMCVMKTFKVVPAAYHASYAVEAEDIVLGKTPVGTAALVDDKGHIVAVVSLTNVAAVFEAKDK